MRHVYAARHDRIVRILERDFRGRLTPLPSAGGLHLTALLTGRRRATDRAVAKRAAQAGVAVLTLSGLYLTTRPRPGLLLGYGALPLGRIGAGLQRLRDCL